MYGNCSPSLRGLGGVCIYKNLNQNICISCVICYTCIDLFGGLIRMRGKYNFQNKRPAVTGLLFCSELSSSTLHSSLVLKPYLNTETPHLDPKFFAEFHTHESYTNITPTPNGMGAKGVYESIFQKQESIFLF